MPLRIVLDALDPVTRRASFVEVESEHDAAQGLTEIERRMRKAGLTNFQLILGEHVNSPSRLEHRWTLETDGLQYRAVFPHQQRSESWAAAYIAVALATGGFKDEQIVMDTWLTAYELIANILDHGKPRGDDAMVELTLCFEPRRVIGIIQDQCERFDPTSVKLPTTAELVHRRSRRGYGMIMVKRMTARLEHQYTEAGNRILFEMRRETAISMSGGGGETPPQNAGGTA